MESNKFMMLLLTAMVILCTTTVVAVTPENILANEKNTTLSGKNGIIDITKIALRGGKFVLTKTKSNITLTQAPKETTLALNKPLATTYYWTTLYCTYSSDVYVFVLTILSGHHSVAASLACNDHYANEVDIHTATSAFSTCSGTFTNIYYYQYSNAIALYYAY